ncbi:MAG: hypothetical protein JXP73_03260 [Deltaproteobacteria bacterium]|nr:hypothetical protein [Deltaproteobacteria bacterium]
MTTREQTVKLGEAIQQLTAVANKSPAAFARLVGAIGKEAASLSGPRTAAQLYADNAVAIASLNGGRAEAAASQVAELEKRWRETAPTIPAVQLAALKALEGESPIRLMMRWDLIQSVKAKGQNPRTVGGV